MTVIYFSAYGERKTISNLTKVYVGGTKGVGAGGGTKCFLVRLVATCSLLLEKEP